MSKNLPLSSYAQKLEIMASLPLGTCIQAVEQVLAEMGAAVNPESFGRRRITAHTYKSVVDLVHETLHVTIAEMGENECLVQMISEPAYQTPQTSSNLGWKFHTIEAFRTAFEHFATAKCLEFSL